LPASLKLIPLSKIKENITQTHKNLTGNADVFWGCVSARTNCGAAKFDLQNGMQLGKGGGEGAGRVWGREAPSPHATKIASVN